MPLKVFIAFILFFSTSAPGFGEIRVTMSEALKSAVTSPSPEYAPLARQARIAGDVVVEVKISAEGDVSAVEPVSGNALLSNPVLRTLKLWKFKPFHANGKATAAITNLRFSFRN